MLTLIFLLVTASLFAYIAQNNFMLVTLHLGTYELSNIPLFYIIMGSLLVGLVLSYFMQVARSIMTAFTMQGKNNTIKQGNRDIVDLTKRIHQLELENEKLKNNSSTREPRDQNAL